MTEEIRIQKVNEVYAKIICEPGTAYELNEYFTFNVPGARFTPAFRNKVWDGKIRLFHLLRQTLYSGLVDQVVKFGGQRGYSVVYDNPSDFKATRWDPEDVDAFIAQLRLPITPRDYQKDCLVHCVQNRRALVLSPTASGKSLIIYMLASMFASNKVLIVVPTIGLVHQIASDFTNDYGCPTTFVHKIFSGQEKMHDAPFVITTWQSIYKQPREWFRQFNTIVGDECLHPDTMISMADGSIVPIKDVSAGDLVMTFNEETLEIEPKPVIKVHHNISVNEQMFELTLNNDTTINITGNHKVLLTSGVWKRVDELERGDVINSIE